VSERHAPRRFTLEDLASADFIARWTATDPAGVAALRAILATITPETRVADDSSEARTLAALAEDHRATAHESGHHPMSDDDAWEWAVRDLVFGGFAPVATAADASTNALVVVRCSLAEAHAIIAGRTDGFAIYTGAALDELRRGSGKDARAALFGAAPEKQRSAAETSLRSLRDSSS
jgi:hypothetical protein